MAVLHEERGGLAKDGLLLRSGRAFYVLRCQFGEQRCFSCGVVGYNHLHREGRQVRKVGEVCAIRLSKLSNIRRPHLVRHMLTIHESMRAALGKVSGLHLAF